MNLTTQNNSKKLGANLLLTLSKMPSNLSMSRDKCEIILCNQYLAIKNLNEQDAVISISMALRFCAEIYCGIKNDDLNDNVLTESALFVQRNYKSISVPEIKIAFEMGAKNEIDVNMVAYYGKFNVSMLGDILTEYLKKRNKAISELEAQHEKNMRGETFMSEVNHKNYIASQEVIEEFKAELEYRKNGNESRYKTFEDVRIHWAKILIYNNIIKLDTDTRKKIYNEAEYLVKRGLQKRAATFQNMYDAKSSRHFLDNIEKGNERAGKEFKEKVEIVYSKLYVWEFLK